MLRKLPHVGDEFTVVVAGYPNVGKSSFIQLVSTATPEVASYPFTTKGVIVGHREVGRDRVQFIDTPGILDRPTIDRNAIELQALTAIVNLADIVLYIWIRASIAVTPLKNRSGCSMRSKSWWTSR